MVGGGLAGAASAARLAKLGHRVTLVERLPVLGGAVGLLERDGFVWDTGPDATALPAVLRDLFRKSGRPLERELSLEPVQPLREHRFGDGTRVTLPSGSRSGQLAAVEEGLGGGLGRVWVDHVHQYAEAWDRLRRDFFERTYAPGLAAPETEALLGGRSSLRRAVHRGLRDPRLRTLALHHAVQGGHDPRRVPAWFGLLDYLEQNFGTWTFPGGFGALAGLLERRLAQRGVTVQTSTTALDVRMGPHGPVAVETDHGPVPAEIVVVAVDPHLLPVLSARVRRTRAALPPAVTHLGLRGPVPDLPREVVLHDSAATLTLRTGGAAPHGAAAWTLHHRGRLAGDPLAALAARGIDVRDAVTVRLERSPQEQVAHWGGSPAGVLWQDRRSVRDRLGTVTPLPHVHAVGAHTGGGGWLPFVGLTAALVAESVGPAGARSLRGPAG